MPKVSVNILTRNRSALLKKAINSVLSQSFKDVEIIVVNDGSTDATAQVLKDLKFKDLKILSHDQSLGITKSRQEALLESAGEFAAILDDDDEWTDPEKLKKQVDFLDNNKDYVLVGGGIKISNFEFLISKQIPNLKSQITKLRPETDSSIRNWMLFKNPFFTSTVMFRKEEAIKAGGFIKDEVDLAEDYDLWLRMGTLGKMYNFQEVFTNYAKTAYNKEKLRDFYRKQLKLIEQNRKAYAFNWLAKSVLILRLKFSRLPKLVP